MHVSELVIDVATAYIVKCACDRGLQEIEKKMEPCFTYRRQCRQENRPFLPDMTLTALNNKLPEMLKRPVGVFDEATFRVYEEFQRPIAANESGAEGVDEAYRRAGQQVSCSWFGP